MREWQQDGRRYFEYKLDHPSLNFFTFMSGRYEVAREEWNGIKLEVYYLKEQPWNVPRMMNSMKKSLLITSRTSGRISTRKRASSSFPGWPALPRHFPGPCLIPNPSASSPI